MRFLRYKDVLLSADIIVKATIQTTLPDAAARVWHTLLQRDAFLHITRGMLGFKGAEEWPEVFEEGQVIETRLLLFNFVPAWRHTLRLIRVDHEDMEIESREEGGPVRRWNHRKWIEEKSERSCLYTDEIDIHAGLLTWLIWAYAHVFYRYRQKRMRQMALR